MFIGAKWPKPESEAVWWATMFARMRHIWDEDVFTTYVQRQYFVEVEYMNEQMVSSPMHCGMGSRLCRSHPASQQTAEQMFRALKRYLYTNGPLKTHMALADRIETIMASWSTPPQQGDENTGRMVLTQLGTRCGLKPDCPESWMLGSDGQTFRRPGGKQQYFATIPTLRASANLDTAGRNRQSHQKITRKHWIYIVCRVGKPCNVSKATAEKMVDELLCRGLEPLTNLLLQHGALQAVDNANAPQKVMLANYTQLWFKHAVICAKIEDQTTICSCWRHNWHGACPHTFFAEELLGWRRWTIDLVQSSTDSRPRPLPASDDEKDVPRKKRRG